ncbi:hypothetical protein Tco_0128699 [Tanacetum coccineum]
MSWWGNSLRLQPWWTSPFSPIASLPEPHVQRVPLEDLAAEFKLRTQVLLDDIYSREIVLKAILQKAKEILLLTKEIKTIRLLTDLAAEFKLRIQVLLPDIYSFLVVLSCLSKSIFEYKIQVIDNETTTKERHWKERTEEEEQVVAATFVCKCSALRGVWLSLVQQSFVDAEKNERYQSTLQFASIQARGWKSSRRFSSLSGAQWVALACALPPPLGGLTSVALGPAHLGAEIHLVEVGLRMNFQRELDLQKKDRKGGSTRGCVSSRNQSQEKLNHTSTTKDLDSGKKIVLHMNQSKPTAKEISSSGNYTLSRH